MKKLNKMERWEQAIEQYDTRKLLAQRLNILAHSTSGTHEYRQRCRAVGIRVEQSVERWETYCNDIAPAQYKTVKKEHSPYSARYLAKHR